MDKLNWLEISNKKKNLRWKEETLLGFDYDLEECVDFGRWTLMEAAT